MTKPFVCWPVSLQMPKRPITFDSSRTALAAAAYIRRDRFETGASEFVDFTKRGSDLVARISIQRPDAPEWTRSSYLRWKLADEASDRTGNPVDIRAWHVVADLPRSVSAGCWVDRVTELVSSALTLGAVADVAIHNPGGSVSAHAHILVASRSPGEHAFAGINYELHTRLSVGLRLTWRQWVDRL